MTKEQKDLLKEMDERNYEAFNKMMDSLFPLAEKLWDKMKKTSEEKIFLRSFGSYVKSTNDYHQYEESILPIKDEVVVGIVEGGMYAHHYGGIVYVDKVENGKVSITNNSIPDMLFGEKDEVNIEKFIEQYEFIAE